MQFNNDCDYKHDSINNPQILKHEKGFFLITCNPTK